MGPQSCTVCGPLALVLRIMRVLSLAPLTIARERAGYRIRVSKRYAYAGYICIVLLNISHAIYFWLEVNLKSKYTRITEPLPLLWLLKLLDVSLGAIISGFGSLFSISRMNNVIEQVYYMEQDLTHNHVGFIDWNMALDSNGGPNWNINDVDFTIIVNTTSGEFYKQPMY
ncbi:unnamed protein product [Colias eurytheme]|nr:unnamed protein product [Colias eurytheme]